MCRSLTILVDLRKKEAVSRQLQAPRQKYETFSAKLLSGHKLILQKEN